MKRTTIGTAPNIGVTKDRVWQRLHIGYAELKRQHLSIDIDNHSKWIEVYPMMTTTLIFRAKPRW